MNVLVGLEYLKAGHGWTDEEMYDAFRYDVQVRAAHGMLIWIDFSLHPLRDKTGKIAFLVPSANVTTRTSPSASQPAT